MGQYSTCLSFMSHVVMTLHNTYDNDLERQYGKEA